MEQKTCTCGSNISNDACCLSIIKGVTAAIAPEQLMRSRYTAFCLRDVNYLTDTYHGSKRQDDYKSDLASHIDDTRWLGLKVVQSGISADDPNKGFVEFIAYYASVTDTLSNIHSRNVKQLHEYSLFVKEGGQWFYVEGNLLPPVKLQRNDLCWCNSGKKIKKCHET